jgi:hypothetical protein
VSSGAAGRTNSDFRLLGDRERVVNLDAEVSNRAF